VLIPVLITFVFIVLVNLVFFKLNWLKFSAKRGILALFFGVHLFLTFIIGLRVGTPSSPNATATQQTVHLIPRLPEPTLATAVRINQSVSLQRGGLGQTGNRPLDLKAGD
jgi:hypothetical protein